MLKLLSLFSGIGAFEKALENIGEPFEVVRYCEIDKYASKAYSLIHNLDENMNLKDVCAVKPEELPDDIDIITYGFPCQDISNAGKQKGFTTEDGNLTRSGLFFEALRIIEQSKPKIAIAENVKALTGKKFTAEFKIVLDSLNDAGYKNYWAVLNAKDYGIPQNRERVFIISIRDDIDHGYQFPAKYELKLRLKDLLEETVDEKYFLSEKMMNYVLSPGTKNYSAKPEINLDVARTIVSTVHKSHRAGLDNYVTESFAKEDSHQMTIDDFLPVKEATKKASEIITVGNYSPSNHNASRVVDPEGLAPTVMENHGTVTAIPIKEATKKGYKEAHDGDYVNLQYPNSETRRGRVGEQIANTLLCNDANGVVISDDPNHDIKPKLVGGIGEKNLMVDHNSINKTGQYIMSNLRIRKLTPKKCFRLMGFDDRDCDILVENKISNTQLYKMAGNSIVVDVLEEIFVELLNQYEDVFPMR